jgi:protein-S-isoprenylcysteine O-methyltransferase Ste14
MNNALFHYIFTLAFLAMVSIRIYYGRKAHQNRDGVELKESKLNLAVRAFFGLGYIGLIIGYIFIPELLEWFAILLPDWVRWIGAFLTLSSVLLLWWVQWALDVQFDTTLHTQAAHKLIQHGPYRWVRHPMYTALFLMGSGWFMLTANWIVGFPLMIGIILVVLSRIKKEEIMLIELFGDEYLDYMQHSSRFIPYLFVGK